jgi:hypothetical protein
VNICRRVTGGVALVAPQYTVLSTEYGVLAIPRAILEKIVYDFMWIYFSLSWLPGLACVTREYGQLDI